MSLPSEAVAYYEREGYVFCPGLLAPAACDALNAELSSIIERIGAEHARGERADDAWRQMPRSLSRIEVFWMPGAEAPRFVERRVIRVGHTLHLDAPLFAEATLRSPIAGALAAALGQGTRVVYAAVVYKQPYSEFPRFSFHQDASYLPSEPFSLALAYLALDDANAENGALIVIPRSHRDGLGERLRLGPEGFECVEGRLHPIDPDRAVLLPMRRGDVALVDGLTYHGSDPNRSARPRRALVIHALAGNARLLPSAWAQEPPEGFPRLS